MIRLSHWRLWLVLLLLVERNNNANEVHELYFIIKNYSFQLSVLHRAFSNPCVVFFIVIGFIFIPCIPWDLLGMRDLE